MDISTVHYAHGVQASKKMYKKIGFLLTMCLIVWMLSPLCKAYLRRITVPSIYEWNEKIRSRVENVTEIRQYTDCGGKITKGPGSIEQTFRSRNPTHNVHCVWKIRAPENKLVYVKLLRIVRTAVNDPDPNHFDDAPFVQIFDGTEATDETRLYKFGDENLNRCLSSERDLIVDLRYNESGKYLDYQALIKYGFIDTDLVEDLIP